jgi:hypothetical protein
MPSGGKVLVVLAAAVACSLVAPSSALAQWPAPKGEAYFSLSYGNLLNRDHYLYDGSTFNGGHIHSNTFLAELGYSITDRLSVRTNLPYQNAKYVGAGPHMFPVDDGSYHGTFTDFRFDARYNVLNRGTIAVTPFVATILPSHHYEYFGHAVNGLDLKQFLVGTAFGFRLESFLPKAYLVGRYSFAFVEKVQDISHNRSNMDLQLGYNLTPRLQLFALGTGEYTHGGTDLNLPVVRATWSAETFHHHVQTGRSQLWGVGGGADFQLTASVDVQAGFAKTLAGKNDHEVNHLITFGVSFGFSPRQVLRKLSSRPPAPMLAPGLL